MLGVDERSPLLVAEEVVHVQNPPSHSQESTVAEPQPNYGASLRRYSSAAGLPPYHHDHPSAKEPSPSLAVWTVIPILLIGVLIGNADGTLVIASSQHIASEFHALSKASWLVTSFVLAACASQSLYGKFSDIFGRKSNLAVAYTFFGVGLVICGISKTFWQVLSGRALSGIGGAGMTALVSIIIADMVPVRDVAKWRSYVNVAATLGRSIGGPLGGWLTDSIGWRWSFNGQVPPTVLGLFLILWKIPSHTNKEERDADQPLLQKIWRIDFLGAFLLAATISAFLLALDFASNDSPWIYISISTASFLLLLAAFYLVERGWAKEPILPLELITNRDAFTPYLISGFQLAAQFGIMYSVPIYFQIATGASVTVAGAHLVPAVVGNATAGLLSGYIITKTGRYKTLTTIGSAVASLGYLLLIIRWKGQTGWVEGLYIFFGGFGAGTLQSTTFVHLAASLDHSDIAIAGTAHYLAGSIFILTGIQLSQTVVHTRLRVLLSSSLEGYKHKNRVCVALCGSILNLALLIKGVQLINDAISSVELIWEMPENIKKVVVSAYIESLTYTYALSLAFAFLGLLVGLTLRERKL